MTPAEKKKYIAETTHFVARGDYKSALEILRGWRASKPGDFYLDYQYAKLLGDWADELPPARRRKCKSESVDILRRLMKNLRGQDIAVRWQLPLNYYYQSEDWKGMYAFGQRFSRTDKRLAAYAKGLAASYLSEKEHSAAWARKSKRAWVAYDLSKEVYYFPHYSLAKALAYAGEFDEARKRLEIAAKKGKRPVTDWEFADVLKLLPKVSASSSKVSQKA